MFFLGFSRSVIIPVLAIPLSLIGQMILSNQYSSILYWVGSLIVLCSFLIINHESKDDAATRDENERLEEVNAR